MNLFRVEIDPAEDTAAFADYLRRLGCIVVEQANACVAAHVAYPETVDDELRTVDEWCASWSRPGRRAIPGQPTALPGG